MNMEQGIVGPGLADSLLLEWEGEEGLSRQQEGAGWEGEGPC